MRNPILQALREAVRSEISNAFKMSGYARPREVARVVCALHPDDVLSIGTRLAEDALTDLARRELKKKHPEPRGLQAAAVAGCAAVLDCPTAPSHQHSV